MQRGTDGQVDSVGRANRVDRHGPRAIAWACWSFRILMLARASDVRVAPSTVPCPAVRIRHRARRLRTKMLAILLTGGKNTLSLHRSMKMYLYTTQWSQQAPVITENCSQPYGRCDQQNELGSCCIQSAMRLMRLQLQVKPAGDARTAPLRALYGSIT
jgi:hypothetical protein